MKIDPMLALVLVIAGALLAFGLLGTHRLNAVQHDMETVAIDHALTQLGMGE